MSVEDASPVRHRRMRAVGAIGASAAVVTAVVVLSSTALGATSVRHDRLPTPHVGAGSGVVTTSELRGYRWSALPNAPIAVRDEGVATVWTGRQMIVWGGDNDAGRAYADGAAYDPRDRTWQRLPAAPLTARSFAAAVWTGRQLFVWGGSSASGRTYTDGATYSPATHQWHRLPPLRVDSAALSTAVWTGDRIVLFTAGGGLHTTTVQVHEFGPADNTWSALASIHIDQSGLLDVEALVAGRTLYAWMPVQTIDHRGLRTGNDAYVYRPAHDDWRPMSLLPTQPQYSVGDTLWTGDHIIFEPNGVECSCGGLGGNSTGSWAEPRTGKVEALPAWLSRDGAGSTFFWTGAAILSAAEDARTAAWDPRTDRWTLLADAPDSGGAAEVWTGTELLVWGQLYAHPSSAPGAGRPPRVAEPTGMQFAATR